MPETNPTLSPDNATVAFTASANATFDIYYNDKVFLVPAAGGTPRLILPNATFEVQSVAWATDGKSLFLSANMGVHNELVRVDVASQQVTPLTKGDHTIANWRYSDTAKVHVFTRNTPTRGSEVTVLPENGGTEPRRVTNVFGSSSSNSSWRGRSASRGRVRTDSRSRASCFTRSTTVRASAIR